MIIRFVRLFKARLKFSSWIYRFIGKESGIPINVLDRRIKLLDLFKGNTSPPPKKKCIILQWRVQSKQSMCLLMSASIRFFCQTYKNLLKLIWLLNPLKLSEPQLPNISGRNSLLFSPLFQVLVFGIFKDL